MARDVVCTQADAYVAFADEGVPGETFIFENPPPEISVSNVRIGACASDRGRCGQAYPDVMQHGGFPYERLVGTQFAKSGGNFECPAADKGTMQMEYPEGHRVRRVIPGENLQNIHTDSIIYTSGRQGSRMVRSLFQKG